MKGNYCLNGYKRAEMEYERAREAECESCEPKIIKAEKAYEPDGYSMEYSYNCEGCEYSDCGYWKDYNETRVLDAWIKPFFENCCRLEKIER